MTGWRVGYIISPQGLKDFFLKVSQNSITNVNPFCQYGAKVALEKREENRDVLEEMLSVYKKRFHQLHILLEEKKKSFIYPGGAFYFFIDAGTSSTEFALDLLEKEGIAVVPGISYGRRFDTYYRISFAVDDYSYDRFYDWLNC
jgi:aminotransferase